MSNVPPPVFVASPVFIHLLHGRDDPDQDMTDWGFAGPLLGPFEAVHFTYREHIRCIEDAHKGTELELRFHEDLLVYAGKYYGDFEICGGQRLDYKNLVPEFFASLDLITGLAESIVRSSQGIRAKWPVRPVTSAATADDGLLSNDKRLARKAVINEVPAVSPRPNC